MYLFSISYQSICINLFFKSQRIIFSLILLFLGGFSQFLTIFFQCGSPARRRQQQMHKRWQCRKCYVTDHIQHLLQISLVKLLESYHEGKFEVIFLSLIFYCSKVTMRENLRLLIILFHDCSSESEEICA